MIDIDERLEELVADAKHKGVKYLAAALLRARKALRAIACDCSPECIAAEKAALTDTELEEVL